jgi:hypothetical protein
MALVYHGQGARYASAGLRATYGDTSKRAGALADQALAALFVRSVWTQERLAAAEGKKKSYIGYRLVFGRFLAFSTAVENPEWGSRVTLSTTAAGRPPAARGASEAASRARAARERCRCRAIAAASVAEQEKSRNPGEPGADPKNLARWTRRLSCTDSSV